MDMWGGFSGSVLALLSLGIRVFAVSLETNAAAINVATANLANILHGGSVESFKPECLSDFLERRIVSACAVAGYTTCAECDRMR